VIFLTTIIVFVVVGGFVVAAGIEAPTADASPRPLVVGGVRFTPGPMWEVARRIPGATAAIQLSRGSGNLLVVVFPGQSDPAAVLDRYVQEILTPEALSLRVSPTAETVSIPSAGTGVRRFYVGTFQDNPAPLEGDVTGMVLPNGQGVAVDGWAQEGTYEQFADDVHRMAETVRPA
jgi:hypothetical protein